MPQTRSSARPLPTLPSVPDEPEAPRYISVGTSALTHLRLVVRVAGAGLVLGLLFAIVRPPVYSAEAPLIVGQGANLTNLAAAAGLEPAEESLAADYSRLVTAPGFSGHVGKVDGSLTASPIPNSTIIQVDATASSKNGALALATHGADALVKVVDTINGGNKAALNSLLSQYQATQVAIAQYDQARSILQGEIAAGGPNVLSENVQLSQLEAQIDAAELEANAEQAQYQATYSPVQAEEATVQTAGPTVYKGTDRLTYLEIGIMAGLLGGLLIGIALAVLADMRPTLPRGLIKPKS